jgi:peptidoglycan/xylan/chitin deacetylase (PgdA/CDA1 family)
MLHRLKSLARPGIQRALFYSGIAWLTLHTRLRRRATVLMYHRVLPSPAEADIHSAESIVVSSATFDRHMRALRRHFNPVSAAELAAMLAGKMPWRPRAVLVTFDDGWFDNAEHAYPILARHGIPAVVFVATGYVGTQNTFWQERLTRLLHRARRLADASAIFERLGAASLAQTAEADAPARVRELVTQIKDRPRAGVDALIVELETRLREHGESPAENGEDRFMSWEQVQRLHRDGLVTIGSHAHTHTPLTALPSDGVARELRTASAALREQLAAHPRFFAYPNGNHDVAAVEEVRKAGLELAFITATGRVTRGSDPLRLPRINIGERGTQSAAGFMCRALCWM